MENYLNLARKYRPTNFNELVGQEVLVQTLKNAFELNKIATGFMLNGIRGTGKTTTARILAKALNCLEYQSPTTNPCNVCSSCIEISNGSSLDVLEMDGASKTSVDDIREIIESTKYKPSSGRYKVYIIDEVHMLSKGAFNALLKTLEEPPEHVKFIFATTEINKVPLTILSRCQKFDLKSISQNEITKHLANICKKENIIFEEEALEFIAKSAYGSMRDALSILDRSIVYCEGTIKKDLVITMLGGSSYLDILELFKSIIKKDINNAFNILETLKDSAGVSIINNLLELCNYILLAKNTNNDKLIKNSYFNIEEINKLAQVINKNTLFVMWQVLIESSNELKNFNNTLTLNMLIMKLIYVSETINVFENENLESNINYKNNLQKDEINIKKEDHEEIVDASVLANFNNIKEVK